MYTWIQSVGACKGKLASELKVGDVMGWNFGSTSTVTAIKRQTPTMVEIEEMALDSSNKPKTYTRKFKKNRVVCIVEDGKFNVSTMTKNEMSGFISLT